MASETRETNDILHLDFNSDYTLFTCGTENGFSIYNCNPLSERISFNMGGGLKYSEVLERSNIIVLVGGGINPRYPTNKAMVWDDDQKKCIGELNFRSLVRGVKISKEYIVVILEYKIYIYKLNDLKIVDSIETNPNSKGLCDLWFNSESNILACPELRVGFVRLEHYNKNKELNSTVIIEAHEGPLACISISQDGKLVATASEKGTLIRVYSTTNGKLYNEFRRGADYAEIYYLAFNKDSDMLVALSSKGTVHVFFLNELYDSYIPPMLRDYLPKYFNSTWSMKQYRFAGGEIDPKTIVGFIDNKTIIVATTAGYIYKLNFDANDKKTTQCILESSTKFVDCKKK